MLYIADNFVNSVQSSFHLSEIRANESKLARLFGVPNAEELDENVLGRCGWVGGMWWKAFYAIKREIRKDEMTKCHLFPM